MKRKVTINMDLKETSVDFDSTAHVMIDMQRDFLDPVEANALKHLLA